MALVSLRQLLDHAAENGYGLPAFNVNNLEQIHAIMQAADECDSPVIMQGSAGARKYAGEPFFAAFNCRCRRSLSSHSYRDASGSWRLSVRMRECYSQRFFECHDGWFVGGRCKNTRVI